MLFNYLFLFMIGSILGFYLELIYRKIVFKKWVKPGVFIGPYLPLYGIGVCVSYVIYSLNVGIVFSLFISCFLLTFVEFICGLIFIKYFKIPLWNYSNNIMNYNGLVCFKFSVYWSIFSLIFICLVFPYINFEMFNIRNIICFMFGFFSIVISDFLYSLFYLFYVKNKN